LPFKNSSISLFGGGDLVCINNEFSLRGIGSVSIFCGKLIRILVSPFLKINITILKNVILII